MKKKVFKMKSNAEIWISSVKTNVWAEI